MLVCEVVDVADMFYARAGGGWWLGWILALQRLNGMKPTKTIKRLWQIWRLNGESERFDVFKH